MRLFEVAAATMVVMVALAIPGVNIYHHLELPTINKYRIVSHYQWLPVLSKHYDITLEDEVGNQYFYEDVLKVLREARYGDTVTFHLAGFGGREDTMYLLINNVHSTRAVVTMSVEAPVYSAYAYLATSGDKLVMAPYTWLMFHFSSILNTDCATETGTDRGQTNEYHCNMFKNTDVALGDYLVDMNTVLTEKEKVDIKNGRDVYIYGFEVMNRISHNYLGQP